MTGGKLSSHESFPGVCTEAARANPPVTLQNGPPKLLSCDNRALTEITPSL